MTSHHTTSALKGVALATAAFFSSVIPAAAQITNPYLTEELGGNPGAASAGVTTATYFVSLWRATISLGSLIVLFYFIWAAIEWITAGGDSGKLNKARDRMVQAVIGFILLVSSAIILGFIGRLFFGDAFNILRPTIPTNTPINPSDIEVG